MVKKLLLKVFIFWAFILTSALGWGQCVDGPNSNTSATITFQGSSTLSCSNQTISITGSENWDGATGGTFQWQEKIGSGSWQDISSETSIDLLNYLPKNNSQYRLLLVFCNGTTDENFLPSNISTTINTTQPAGSGAAVNISLTSGATNLCSDDSVSFSSSINTDGGTDPHTLQWETSLNGGSWNPIASETTNSLANFDPPAGDNRFRLVVTFCDGTVVESSPSSTITATQEVGSGAGVSISLTSGATSICSDETVSFSSSVDTNGGTDNYSLQWETSLNGGSWNPIASETTNSLTNFDPPAGNNRVRLVATFCDATVILSSPSSTITATQEIGSGAGISISLTSGSTSICSDETVSFDGSINLNGGTDGYTLRWEEQLNNGSWTTISSEIGEDLTDYSPSVGNNRFRLIATFCDGSVLTSSNSQLITVNQVKTGTVSISASSTTICPGENINFSASATNHGSGATYDWQVNGESKSSSSSFSSTSIPAGSTVQLFMTSSLPCVEPFESNVITVSHKPAAPDTPGTITGDQQVCPNTSGITYFIAAVDRATSYQWTLPSGWSGSSTDESITVTSGNVGDNQIIKVKAINECGESAEQTISVNVGPGKPATPSAISDPGLICPGSSVTLSVTNDPAINSYTWTVPTGWNITNGQGTNEITITAGNYGQNGTVSVYSTNDCLDSNTSSKNFTINEPAPATPGIINGNDVVCPNTDITYSITAVQYADEYIWYYNGTEVSGQNGTSITVNSGAGGDKNVEVIAVNECSSSDYNSILKSTKAIKVDDGTPEPTSITLTHTELNNGESYFCPEETGFVFSIPTDAKIDTYSWQVPSGWTVTSGAGTNEITATAGQLGNDGQIIFTGSSNDCGSVTATYDVYVKDPAPVITSETISGDIEVCHDATGLTYSIPAVEYATSYTWSVPTNWNITSGDGTNSITVSAGTDDGNITVKANNDCGESSEIILNVSSIDSAPPALGTIFSDPGTVSQVCPPAEFDFWVDEVSGADSYSWTLPPGWEILSGENTSRIHIKVTNSAAYNNENVTVFASNICGDTQSVAYTDITVSDYIITDLGEDQTVCSTQSPIAIPGEISFGSAKKFDPIYTAVNGAGTTVTGNLSDLPTNTNSYPNNFTFYYNPTTNDIASGSVTISVQVPKPVTNKNDPDACGTGYAEMTIIFRPDPSASITATPAICINQTAEVSFTATPNTTVTYKIGSGANQTVAIDESGTAIVTTGAFNTTTTISLVSIQYSQAPSCSKTLTGSATVTVNPVPDVDISYNTPYCHTDNVATVSFANEIGAWEDGTFSATGELGAVINTDGSFDPSSVTPNTYTITYTMPAFGGCEEVSVTTDVKILEKVVVAQQPEDIRFCEGGNAHFEIGATGDGLTYQWYKDAASPGNEINGATSATLDISSISPADAGDYFVVVSGASPCSPINSEAATLTVDENIVINTQPEELTVCENSSAAFSFSATSGGTEVTSSDYTFQWYKGTPGSGTPVGGATLADFTIDPASPSDNGDYYVEITGPSEFQCEPTLSEAATLTVRSTPIVEISGTTSICSGNSADINFTNGIPNGIVTYTLNNDNINPRTFSLDASGEGTLNTGNLSATDGDSDGKLDNTNFVYEIQSVAYPDDPDCSSNVSGSVTITVSPVPNPQISFPNDQIEFCTADGAAYTPSLDGQGTFTGGTFSANGDLNIDSSTGAFIPSNQDSGDYIITYSYPTAGGCSEGSTMLNISIYEEVKITSDPFNVGICSTQNAEFSVTATGDDLSFQWYKDGSLLPGETAATLSLPVATSEDAGEYYVVVSGTNACTPTEESAVESGHAFLNVDEDIVILEPAEDISVCETGEESVTFRFIAHANGAPLKFKWIYSNGDPVPIDGTKIIESPVTDTLYGNLGFSSYTGTLTINNIVEADEAEYAVEIDGSDNNFNCPIAVSNAFQLEVNPLPDGPVVENVEYCTGDVPVALTAIGDDLQWYDVDMNPLSDAPVPPVSDTDAEFTYYVTQTPLYCESEPSEIKVFVYARPGKPGVAETVLDFCLGENALALEATAADIYHTLNWYDSENSTTPLDQAPTPQTTSKGTSYFWVSQTNPNECEGEREKITVLVHDLPDITPPEDQTICEGTEITLSATDENITDDSTSFTWEDGNGNTLTGSSITITPSETVTYTITGSNSNGCSNTEGVTVTVDPTPEGGTLDGPASVCETDITGKIDLLNSSGEIDRWEYKNSSVSDWTSISNSAGLEFFDFSDFDLLDQTSFRAVLTSGICDEVFSTEHTVSVDPLPVGGELNFAGVGRVFMICEGADPGYAVDLVLTGKTGEVTAWQYRSSSATSWTTIEGVTGTTLSADKVEGLNVSETTVFQAIINSGACTQNALSKTAILSVIPTDIAPSPVTVNPGVVCLGSPVTLSSETGYGTGESFDDRGAFDNASITQHGWRVRRNGNSTDIGFDTDANNTQPDRWKRATPHPFTTANLSPNYNTTDKTWGSGIEDGNKGFAVVSSNNSATMETPVFSIGAMDQAILTFDQAYNLTPGASINVEISTNGGNSYNTVLYSKAPTDANQGITSDHIADFGLGTKDNRPDNKIEVDLGNYLGQGNLRIRFSYIGTRLGDVWAIDNIKIPEGPNGVEMEWNDYSDPDNPIYIGNNNSEQYTPTQIGWNNFEVKTKLIFDSEGNACEIAENSQTIKVFVFDQYTTSATATIGSCGNYEAQLSAAVSNGINEPVTNYPTPDGFVGKWEIPEGTTLVDSDPDDDIDAINDPNASITSPSAGTYSISWVLEPTATYEDGQLISATGNCPPVVQPVEVVIRDCTALDFDGVNDYVDLDEGYTGAYSIEAWIRPEAATGTIISGPSFEITMSDLPATVVPNTRWYHIAASNGKLYVDGIDVKAYTLRDGSDRAFIGAKWEAPNVTDFFSGWIEEVRIWNGNISQENIRFTMNQRLKATGNIGVEVDMDHPDAPDFDNLSGYYQLIATDILPGGYTRDLANNAVDGKLRNMETLQENTAPLPYTTSRDNFLWTDEGQNGPWTNWDVWDIPNAEGIDGTPIEWNIVRTSNYLESGLKDIKILGLIVESNELDILNSSGAHDETNSGQRLEVTHYLKIDGLLDLTGESQLLQPEGSIVDAASSGTLERDQQGTASSYNYNYWSSPVSPGSNNAAYTVGTVMMDGSNSSAPQGLAFGNPYAHADGDFTVPRKVSAYWLHKFHGTANNYYEWIHIGSTGSLQVGEGYSMKGTSGKAPWKSSTDFSQNYTFKGLPNNGDVSLTIGTGENYLIGNPYPSAMDADKFINDHLQAGGNSNNVFNGTIYFWSHFSGATHYLQEYVGGYATYNLSGGAIAYANDERINATGGSGGEKPQQFIPVGQGFFVNTMLDESLLTGSSETQIQGGQIVFRNEHRFYQREIDKTESVFHSQEKKDGKSPSSSSTTASSDERSKIWLKFKSPKGYHRQILVTADSRASDNFDLGFDAPLIEDNVEDMYWFFKNYQFVIQGVSDFNIDRELNLGVKVEEKGSLTIKIDDLMNIPDAMNIFLEDSLHQVVHDLRAEEYVTESEAGIFTDRFKLVFKDKTAVVIEPEEPVVDDGEFEILYVNKSREILVRNPQLIDISRAYLSNALGQQVHVYYDIHEQEETKLPVHRFSSGVYIVKVHTEKGIVTKKVILE